MRILNIGTASWAEPALGPVRALQRRRERGAEDFEIDQFLEPRRRIADFRKLLVTLIQIEKSRPPTIAIFRASAKSESRQRQKREVFRGVRTAIRQR